MDLVLFVSVVVEVGWESLLEDVGGPGGHRGTSAALARATGSPTGPRWMPGPSLDLHHVADAGLECQAVLDMLVDDLSYSS